MSTVQTPILVPKSLLPTSKSTPPAVNTWPTQVTCQPSKFDSFDVKYGSFSTVDAFFVSLTDLLHDPMIQIEFELDTLENLLKEISSQNARLTHHVLIASKSDPDMHMYHEAIMATGKQDFVMQ